MSGEMEDASIVMAPLEGEMLVIALSTTVAAGNVTAIGPGWYTFDAEGCTAYITFNVSATITDPNPVATSGNGRCYRLMQDREREFFLDSTRMYFEAITSTGTGYLRVIKSNRP